MTFGGPWRRSFHAGLLPPFSSVSCLEEQAELLARRAVRRAVPPSSLPRLPAFIGGLATTDSGGGDRRTAESERAITKAAEAAARAAVVADAAADALPQ